MWLPLNRNNPQIWARGMNILHFNRSCIRCIYCRLIVQRRRNQHRQIWMIIANDNGNWVSCSTSWGNHNTPKLNHLSSPTPNHHYSQKNHPSTNNHSSRQGYRHSPTRTSRTPLQVAWLHIYFQIRTLQRRRQPSKRSNRWTTTSLLWGVRNLSTTSLSSPRYHPSAPRTWWNHQTLSVIRAWNRVHYLPYNVNNNQGCSPKPWGNQSHLVPPTIQNKRSSSSYND